MSPFSIPSSLLTCPTGNGKHDGKDKEGIYLHLRAAKNGAVFYPLLIEMESTDLQISNKLQIVCIPLTVPMCVGVSASWRNEEHGTWNFTFIYASQSYIAFSSLKPNILPLSTFYCKQFLSNNATFFRLRKYTTFPCLNWIRLPYISRVACCVLSVDGEKR